MCLVHVLKPVTSFVAGVIKALREGSFTTITSCKLKMTKEKNAIFTILLKVKLRDPEVNKHPDVMEI